MVEIDRYDALGYVSKMLEGMSPGNTMTPEEIRRNAALALDLDIAFMKGSGVFDGDEYDDNAAFEYISRNLARYEIDESFIEDYMEAMESYLEKNSIISWDGK